MRKLIILVFIFVSMASFGQKKNKKVTFEVDGVCQMCKMRIEKAALGVKGVKYAAWDIPTQQLALILDERKTNAMHVKMALAGVGHDTKELKASEEVYAKMHVCCQYRALEDNEKPKKHH